MAGRTEDATQAMQAILQRYAMLMQQGEALRQILTAGGIVPCEVWGAYNDACLDYLGKSQKAFDQLAQRGIDVDQVVYDGGQPAPDPDQPGYYKTLRIQAPLRPPAFGLVKDACPGVPVFQGSTTGWVPVPITDGALGAVASTVWSSITSGAVLVLTDGVKPIGAVAPGGFKTYKTVAIWLDDFSEAPLRVLQAFTDCVGKLTKTGMTADQAIEQCTASAKQMATPASRIKRWGFWAAVAASGMLILYLRHRRAQVVARHAELAPESSAPEDEAEGEEAPAEAPAEAVMEGFDDCCSVGW